MILVIDNYDSFTYNLVQILLKQSWPVEVIKNDEWTSSQLDGRWDSIRGFLISPGPGRPQDSGLCLEVARRASRGTPIFGVCLGHQVLGESVGARLIPAPRIMHGKISRIEHSGHSLYQDCPQPFSAVRYHSWILEESSLPPEVEVTAWTQDEKGRREIMGLRHRSLPWESVQFHPESALTESGESIVRQFFAAHTKF